MSQVKGNRPTATCGGAIKEARDIDYSIVTFSKRWIPKTGSMKKPCTLTAQELDVFNSS